MVVFITALLTTVALKYNWADRGGFVEEAVPFRQALTLWGWGDRPATANPHFFSYPSLSIYAQWFAQSVAVVIGLFSGRYATAADAGVEFVLDPSYMVGFARAMSGSMVFACALLAYVWWRSRSRPIGWFVASVLCLSPLFVRSVVRMPPEVLMAPLAVLLVAVATSHKGRRFRLVATGILAGLLVGTKLSAVPCAAVCLWFVSRANRPEASAVRSMVTGCAISLLTFLATTPYAILDYAAFRNDTHFEWEHLRSGHMLGSVAASANAHLIQLLAAVGYALPLALLALPFVSQRIPTRAWLALTASATFVVPAVLASSGGPERYVLPIVPLLWLLVAEVFHACASGRTWPGRAAAALILVTGLMHLGMMATRSLAGPVVVPTAAASEWLTRHAGPHDIIVQERGSLALLTKSNVRELEASRCYQGASERWRDSARSARWFSVVALPFVASGEISTQVRGPDGSEVTVRAFYPGWKVLPSVYEVLDEIDVQYIARNQSISARLTRVFPELEWEQLHERPDSGWITFEGSKGRAREDADVAIQSVRHAAGGVSHLAPDWWESGADFRIIAEQSLPTARPVDHEVLAIARRQVFAEWIEPFLGELAELSVARGEMRSAARAARLILTNDPENLLALRIAILALADVNEGVSGKSTSTELHQAPIESERDWIVRVLTDWGLDQQLVDAETARYLTWRHGARRQAK